MNIADIVTALSAPFAPHLVDFRPGKKTRDGRAAIALAYVDPRQYMERLDQATNYLWDVGFQPWGDRIICTVTIWAGEHAEHTLSRSSTGEAEQTVQRQGQVVVNPIAGVTAEAQAFKRACMAFGLGRYLYSLPQEWADLDEGGFAFTPTAINKLRLSLIPSYNAWAEENGRDKYNVEALPQAAPVQAPRNTPAAPAPLPRSSSADDVDIWGDGGGAHPNLASVGSNQFVDLLRQGNENGSPASEKQTEYACHVLGRLLGFSRKPDTTSNGSVLLKAMLMGQPAGKETLSYIIDKLSDQSFDRDTNSWVPNVKYDEHAAESVRNFAAKVFGN